MSNLLKLLKYISAALICVVLLLFAFTKQGSIIESEINSKIISSPDFNDNKVSLCFLNVEQADCAVIKCSDKYIMVDSGGYPTRQLVEEFLRNNNITHLDAFICTHPDSDHYGALLYLCDFVRIISFYQPDIDLEETATDYQKVVNTLRERGTEINYLVADDELRFGTALFTVVGPVYLSETENDMSLVFKITCGDFTLLFCGDMEDEELNDIIESETDLKSSILKVAHHGSKTGTNEEFLDLVKPECAVISVGNNYYNLPNYDILKLLDNNCNHVYRTDVDGNILITYDGYNKYNVYTERN